MADGAPSFNLTYNTPTVDIGSGYAAGIKQAGQSVVDAIKGVTSIMDQSNTANDMINQFAQMKDSQGNPIISPDERDSLMQKGLGARNAFVGELLGRFHTAYAAQLEQANRLAQIQAQAAAAAPYQQAAIAATGEQQRQTAAQEAAAAEASRLKEIQAQGEQRRQEAEFEARLYALRNPDARLVTPGLTPPNASGADRIQSPLQRTLDSSKVPPPPPTQLIPPKPFTVPPTLSLGQSARGFSR